MQDLSEQELEIFGERFITSFEACRRALVLYPPKHPKVSQQLQLFHDNLKALRTRTGEAMIYFMKGELFVNGKPLKKLSITFRKNILSWEELGIGLIRFEKDLSREMLLIFFQTIIRSKEELDACGGAVEALVQAGVEGIQATRVVAGVADGPAEDGNAAGSGVEAGQTGLEEARVRFAGSLERLQALAGRLRSSPNQTAWMLESFSHTVESRMLGRHPVRRLAEKLARHDLESYQHALNGAIISVLMGAVLGFELEALRLLGEAALLRDVGKTRVAPALLHKRGADEPARAEYEKHPLYGAKLLLASGGIDGTAAIVALEHHVGHNLRGFPRLRTKRCLHPFSRIAGLASDFDRVTGGYAGAQLHTTANAMLKIVAETGSTYDPAAVRGLLRLVGYVPEGTAVRLRDGREGIVTGIGRRTWLAPEVAILREPGGAEIAPKIVETDALVSPGQASVATVWVPKEAEAKRLSPLRWLD
jgi:HD-GYP domain-containing protein (c-di-GMP phosphodiesterase class II)